MFNKKFRRLVRWLLAMKHKHHTYRFQMIVTHTEIVIWVDGTDDQFRIFLT
jgi:hypothetical protein